MFTSFPGPGSPITWARQFFARAAAAEQHTPLSSKRRNCFPCRLSGRSSGVIDDPVIRLRSTDDLEVDISESLVMGPSKDIL